ncbi:MAG TPA: ABC transporter ATP-binding protein [Pyrinomonadaceae bacterium]|nr:ABC transporter ATP-binding protein [Pyrinomonadaceae bacterium]
MSADRHPEIRWLTAQIRPFLRLHVASYFCIGLASIFVLIDPLIVRFLIDDVIPQRRFAWLPGIALAFFITYAGRLVFDSIAAMLNFRASQRMSFQIRLALLRHLQRLSAEYHDNKRVGDTLHRLQVDVEQVGTLSTEVIPNILHTVMVFALVMTTMLVLNYRLTIIVIPLVPMFLLVRRRFHNRLRQASDSVQEQAGKVVAFLEEHLSSITQVQLLSCELREARRFARLSSSAVRAQIKRRRIELFFSSLLALIIVIGTASVLLFGGYQVMVGTLTAGGLVAFYGYTVQLFIPLYGVVDIYSKLQRAGASIRRLMEITQAETIVRDSPGALVLRPNASGSIELRNVVFSYPSERPILSGINLRVSSGERVALAGVSGNGKTTIARLVARLYEPRSGAVLVDGIDVRQIQLKSLRSSIVFVPQEPVLFDMTLSENLRYGNAHASWEELERVAKLAQLESLIQRLPCGWDEPLGPRGNRLSGGERQRVALARALLQHPRILIMDECTSALDAPTEKSLLDALDNYLCDVTTIIISHRPYPLQWADRVISMSQGIIIEENGQRPATEITTIDSALPSR